MKTKEYIELIKKVNLWNFKYYQENDPVVDDATYDKALRELIEFESQHPNLIDASSPTQKVGSDLIMNSTFKKVKHQYPVLSLANAFNLEELIKFQNSIKKQIGEDEKISFVVEPKLDGSHIVLTYNDGKLVRAVTRGNGIIGEDITENAKQIVGIPHQINSKKELVVDGEVLIKNSDFLKINELLSNEEKYANSRNLAAGSIKQKDVTKIKDRHLIAFLYDAKIDGQELNTQMETLTFLKEQGFNVDQEITKYFENVEQAWSYLEKMDRLKETIDLPLDGMVLKLNERKFYKTIGTTAKVPKYNIAYKFPPTIKQTKVKSIYSTTGRTGKITYVAELEPVNIDGVVVTSVTLHNFDYIKEKDIRVGDVIELYRSGMVIPKVNQVILEKRKKNSKPFEMIKTCSICHQNVKKVKVEDVDYFCLNNNCPSKIINQIIHFTTRDAMNIEGLSEKTIEKFYQAELIKNAFDLYEIENFKNVILEKKWNFGEKSWNNLIQAIDNSKNNSLERLIFALGIPNVGKTMAKKIAISYRNLENFWNTNYEELKGIDDIGEISAQEILKFIEANQHIPKLVKKYKINEQYISSQNKEIDESNIFYGKKICITGSFEDFNREELKNILENEYGAINVGGVSKNINFLIVGENAGSKLKKAQDLGIVIIDEDKLKEVLKINQKEAKNQPKKDFKML